jgi:hypothetical protein
MVVVNDIRSVALTHIVLTCGLAHLLRFRLSLIRCPTS